jgi:uncharacterized protein (TIGR03067 family)
MRLGPIAVLTVTIAFHATGVLADDASEKEVQRIQGRWKPIKIEGRNPGKVDGLTVTIKGDAIVLEGATEKPLRFTYKLQPSAKPKAIDITFELGTLLGVYELDEDTLKVCYSELQESQKGKRPAELSATAGSMRYFWVLKREK